MTDKMLAPKKIDAKETRAKFATPYERIVQVFGAFDKRHEDPSKNYGIGSMELLFILKNDAGAMQFSCSTGMYLKHVAAELFARQKAHNPFEPMGTDIGYHAHTPQYDDQSPMMDDCEVIGGRCYYDGTSLGAAEFMPEFLRNGSEAVWKMLEERHRYQFGDPPPRTDIPALGAHIKSFDALIEAIEEESGADCHRTSKAFSQKPCGMCSSCFARELLGILEGK